MGNSGSSVAKPEMKWFLNVRIARSAALVLCMLGGVSWYVNCFLIMAFLRSLDASLSIMYVEGAKPLDSNLWCRFIQACFIS